MPPNSVKVRGTIMISWRMKILILVALICFPGLTSAPAAPQAKVKIVLVGDSTVNDGGGWGAGFKRFLKPGAECINTARNGRSSKSFRDEGRWTNALALKGDYYLIQFAHNNEPGKPGRSTDMATFVSNMVSYVEEARVDRRQTHPGDASHAAPVGQRTSRKIKSSLEPYAQEVRKIAGEKHVPLLDLHARSIEVCEQMGPEKCVEFSPKKKVNGVLTDEIDGTHLNPKGSMIFARVVVEELRKNVPDLAPLLRNEPFETGVAEQETKQK